MKGRFNAVEWVLILTLGVLIFILMNVPLWLLWTAVVPYFWPSGPNQVIDPPFWMFLGGIVLASLVLRSLGRKG